MCWSTPLSCSCVSISHHYHVDYNSAWMTTRVVVWLSGLSVFDLQVLFDAAGCSVPAWLEALLNGVESLDPTNLDFPGEVPGMPSVFDLLSAIPKHLSSGGSLPLWGGYETGGFVVIPGGEIQYVQNPYDCILSDFVYSGTSVFFQSGLFSGALSLVTSAYAYYRRVDVPEAVYPGIDVNQYYPVGVDAGWVTVYPSKITNPTQLDPIVGMPVSQWHDYDPNPVVSSYVPAWQFPPVNGGFPDWHFLSGKNDFEVSTHELSSGFGYLQFNKPWPEYDPSMEPVGFNASYPSTAWLTAMQMERNYYNVSAEITRVPGALSNRPKITPAFGGTPRIHVRPFPGGGRAGGSPVPLIPISTGGGEGSPVPLIPISTGGGEISPGTDLLPVTLGGGVGAMLSASGCVLVRLQGLDGLLRVGDDILTAGNWSLGG